MIRVQTPPIVLLFLFLLHLYLQTLSAFTARAPVSWLSIFLLFLLLLLLVDLSLVVGLVSGVNTTDVVVVSRAEIFFVGVFGGEVSLIEESVDC